jgi:hypothetical protein
MTNMTNKTAVSLALSLTCVIAGGCGDDSAPAVCGDAGCADGGTVQDAGIPYVPASGLYKVIDYMAVNDGCMIGLQDLTNSSKPQDWIMVRVEGNLVKVGTDRGTPPLPSLGQGYLAGRTIDLSRSNHVKAPDPSPCEYDSTVQARVTLDDPTSHTIGLSVREEQTNRTMCTIPADVGSSCTSTWSWRLTPMGM